MQLTGRVQEAQEAGAERGQCFPDDVPADYGRVVPWIAAEMEYDDERRAALATEARLHREMEARLAAMLLPVYDSETPF